MKKAVTLVSALMLSLAFGITAVAAPSVDTTGVTADSGNTYTEEQTQEYAAETTVQTSVAGTVIIAVTPGKAAEADNAAKMLMGSNAVVTSVVDLSAPEGTGTAEFTLCNADIQPGMSVTILHQKADGTWEAITPSAVGNGTVTFTMTSYSPVAIVINAVAPRTADVSVYVIAMAVLCLAGACVAGKKAYGYSR